VIASANIRARGTGLSYAKGVLLLRVMGIAIASWALSSAVAHLGITATAIADAWEKQFLPRGDYLSRLYIAVQEAWDWIGIAWWFADSAGSILLLALGAGLAVGKIGVLQWLLRVQGVRRE
jgi:hypothetical protein